MIDTLLDDAKVAMAKKLQEVEAKSRHVRKCLLVELEGYGRFNAHAVRAAWEAYQGAIEAAAEIPSAEVKASGLFVDPEARRIEVDLGRER
jgi:hypothetical protein